MNIWSIIISVAKIALWVILGFIGIVGFSRNVTELLNDILKKRDVRNDVITNMLIWVVLIFFSLAFLFKAWFL